MKLSSIIEGYWLDNQLDFSPKTVVNYTHYCNHLIDFVGDIAFEQINYHFTSPTSCFAYSIRACSLIAPGWASKWARVGRCSGRRITRA